MSFWEDAAIGASTGGLGLVAKNMMEDGNPEMGQYGLSQAETEIMQEMEALINAQKGEIAGFRPFVLEQYGFKETSGMYKETDSMINDKLSKAKDELAAWHNAPGGWEKDQALASVQQRVNDLESQLRDPSLRQDALQTRYEKTPQQLALEAQQKVLQQKSLQLAGMQMERQKLALEGKIPSSVALQRQKEKEFSLLKEAQGRIGNEIIGDNLDNATAKSTTGIQALQALREQYGLIEDAERRGIIAGESGVAGNYLGQYGGARAAGTEAAPYSPYSGLVPQYGAMMQPYQQTSAMNFQADQFNQIHKNDMLTGLLTLGGTIGGAYLGGAK